MNLALLLKENSKPNSVEEEVLFPSLCAPFYRLLDNAGYDDNEIEGIMLKMIEDRNKVYDVENAQFGDPKKLGIFDATLAVEQALKNAVSIASVMGTLGGIVAFPRDNVLELQEHKEQMNFQRNLDHAGNIRNEADERP